MYQQRGNYRGDIDGLRAIAVLGVIFFHFGLFNVSGGFVGVDVFFVISGYLITKQILGDLKEEKFSFKAFYIRRIRRLFPALAAMVFIALLMSFLLLSPDDLISMSKSSVAALFSVSNVFFWLDSGYFAAASETKPLLHTWTLGVEEQFYLIWPILLLIAWKLAKAWLWWTLALLLMFLPIVFAEYYMGIDQAAVFYWLPFRLSEFLMGGLVIFAERKYPNKGHVADASFLLGLGAILYAFFMFSQETRFPGWSALLPCVGAGLMIWSKPSSLLRYMTSNPVAIGLGLISYSLYLWHWPLWVFYKYWRFTPLTLNEKLGLLVACILMGWLSYRYIEQPFRRPKELRPHPHRRLLISCAVIFLLILSTSISISRSDGLIWRFDGAPTNYVVQANSAPGDECYARLMPMFECVSGRRDNNPANTLFLLGDSHGQAIRLGVTELLGDKYRIINSTVHTCPPLFFGYDVVKNKDRVTGCNAANKKLYQKVKQGDVIVLAARWSLYIKGEPAGLEDAKGNVVQLSHQGELKTNATKAEALFKEGLDKTVAYWIAMKKKVILIAQVPPVGVNPVPCLYRPPYLIQANNKTGNCRYFTRQQVLQRIESSNKIIADIAKKRGVLALLPSRKLCPKEQKYCAIFNDNNELLYRDDDHLNNFGSRYVMRLFEQEVANYLHPKNKIIAH